jgi:hypothetical protein
MPNDGSVNEGFKHVVICFQSLIFYDFILFTTKPFKKTDEQARNRSWQLVSTISKFKDF